MYLRSRRSIIKLLDLLIEHAHAARASDIHLDPRQGAIVVRLRIDGLLQEAHSLPLAIHEELIARIKILAGLRTDEHYAAQDGRFRFAQSEGTSIDIRVSIAPTYYGENAVLRLLAGSAAELSLDALSFAPSNREKITRAIARPHGMILATGPTGSGKTTTLYSLVKGLNARDISIVTLEDPIEYSIDGVRQVQINPKTGLSFGSGLRSLLRQDPDIIMVGEIRDEETAGLAIHTALTGHLLLSTLHTNDAPSTIVRLLDMGVEAYLIASTLSLVIGQRLVRKICDACKREYEPGAALRTHLQVHFYEPDEAPMRFFRGEGCASCGGTGYRGRAGVHEVIEIDDKLRAAIMEKISGGDLRALALQNGMVSINADAIHKAREGITTVEEVLRLRYE